jgi:hypothetical protein
MWRAEDSNLDFPLVNRRDSESLHLMCSGPMCGVAGTTRPLRQLAALMLTQVIHDRCWTAGSPCPAPGELLLEAERLGHVVVGAGVQPGDAALDGVAGGQHDHRDAVAAGADLGQRDSSSAIRMGSSWAQRQVDGELGAESGCAREGDGAAVCFRDRPHDGQIESGALPRCRRPRARTVRRSVPGRPWRCRDR